MKPEPKSPIQHGQDMMNSIADALESADKVPPSRELALAKTKLDEAVFWGNRALMNLQGTINEKPGQQTFADMPLIHPEPTYTFSASQTAAADAEAYGAKRERQRELALQIAVQTHGSPTHDAQAGVIKAANEYLRFMRAEQEK